MSNKYWTDKTDNEDIIAAADFNNAFDNIAIDMDEKAEQAEITIKSISANGSAIVPDENKNVDIDIKSVVKQSYLFGTGAPTTSTAAEFVGQLYSDTQNIKLYQCTGITEAENGTKTYEWIKVIRDNNYATYKQAGVVSIDAAFGTGVGSQSVGGTVYQGVLQIIRATDLEIDQKSQGYKPIVPANLDYAVRSVRPAASDTAPTTLAVNTLYSINNTSSTSVALTLPQGQNGDFIQYDFVTGTTAPTVTIQSTYGMTKFDFTPEANKIYSLFFDWGIIAVSNTGNTYGWRISFAEYDYDDNVAEVLPEEAL